MVEPGSGVSAEQFRGELDASVEAVRADPVVWKDYQDEIRLFEGGSMDGLENEGPYYSPEEEDEIRDRHDRPEGR